MHSSYECFTFLCSFRKKQFEQIPSTCASCLISYTNSHRRKCSFPAQTDFTTYAAFLHSHLELDHQGLHLEVCVSHHRAGTEHGTEGRRAAGIHETSRLREERPCEAAATTAYERQGNMKGRKPDSRARMRDLARGRVTTAVVNERVTEQDTQDASRGEEDNVLKRRSWALDGLLDCLRVVAWLIWSFGWQPTAQMRRLHTAVDESDCREPR